MFAIFGFIFANGCFEKFSRAAFTFAIQRIFSEKKIKKARER